MQQSVCVWDTVGCGRHLLIVAILPDTKLGVVMSAVMSSCQCNRSAPLARPSDRWDGQWPLRAGTGHSHTSRRLSRSHLSSSSPFTLSFTLSLLLVADEALLTPSTALFTIFPCLCAPSHTQVLIMSDVSIGLAAPVRTMILFSLSSKAKLDSVHVHNEEM